MNITFKGNPVTLVGKQLQVNDVMPCFPLVKNDLSELRCEEGKRIYLSVPSLDTGVCSMEVAKFMEYMKAYSDVLCYSVSMDLPFALERWCQAKENEQVITTSDYKYREFAKATGTLVEELGLLTRAVFVVDENNVIRHVEYLAEIANEPNYDAILNAVATL
ncbi:thiol peroxidase [Amedibacillus sp. YH-ame10]